MEWKDPGPGQAIGVCRFRFRKRPLEVVSMFSVRERKPMPLASNSRGYQNHMVTNCRSGKIRAFTAMIVSQMLLHWCKIEHGDEALVLLVQGTYLHGKRGEQFALKPIPDVRYDGTQGMEPSPLRVVVAQFQQHAKGTASCPSRQAGLKKPP